MKNREKIHDDWETPKDLIEYIQKKYFNGCSFFDPCPLNHKFNGLAISWGENNFINPPYNRKDKEAFIIKALEESKKGKNCVLLLPVSTSTRIFHEVILPHGKIEFIKGRVKFKGFNSKGEYVYNKCGQHDSMIIFFKGHKC